MRLEARKYLLDISEALRLVNEFTRGRSLEEFRADALLRAGVERELEVAGEAVRQLLAVEPALEARLTDARRIVAFRNRLVHGYATLSSAVIWGIVEANVPVLAREVAGLLEEWRPEG